jgi:hypothetical protein
MTKSPPELRPLHALSTSTSEASLPAHLHGAVWAALLALIVFFAILSTCGGQRVWDGWRESDGLRRPTYAERIYPDNFFRTWANTWSNLSFIAVGFYCIALGWNDLRQWRPARVGYLVNTPAMSFLFGSTCCWLGFGSGFFHASLTRIGQQLDVASMFGPLVAILAVSLGLKLPRIKLSEDADGWPTWPWLVGMTLIAEAAFIYFKWSMSSRVTLNLLCILVGISAPLDRFWWMRNLELSWLVWAVVALAVGTACRQLDVARLFSDSNAWSQGHALWHLFTAASLGLMYLYYRSESAQQENFTILFQI